MTGDGRLSLDVSRLISRSGYIIHHTRIHMPKGVTVVAQSCTLYAVRCSRSDDADAGSRSDAKAGRPNEWDAHLTETGN